MRRRLMTLALALSLAVPSPIYAAETAQPTVATQSVTEDVINLSMVQGQEINIPLLEGPQEVEGYELLEGKLPIGVHIAGGQKDYVGGLRIIGKPVTKVHDEVVKIKVIMLSGETRDFTINIDGDDNVTENSNIYFTKTTPDNIWLSKGEEFTLTDKLSDGSEPIYFLDKVYLKKKVTRPFSIWEHTAIKRDPRGPFPVPSALYDFYINYALGNNYGNYEFEDDVVKIENGKIIAGDYGSAIIWVADRNYNVVKPICVNVRDSRKPTKEKYGSVKSSFIKTTNLAKTFTGDNVLFTVGPASFYNENARIFELYSDGYLSTQEVVNAGPWKAENLLPLDTNFRLDIEHDRGFVTGEFLFSACTTDEGQYVHNDRYFYTLRNQLSSKSIFTRTLKSSTKVNIDLNNLIRGGVGTIRFSSDNLPDGLRIENNSRLVGTLTTSTDVLKINAIDEWGSKTTVNTIILVERDKHSFNVVTEGEGEATIFGYSGITECYHGDTLFFSTFPADGYNVGEITANGDKINNVHFEHVITEDTTFNVKFVPTLKVKDNIPEGELNVANMIEGGQPPYSYSLQPNDKVTLTDSTLSAKTQLTQNVVALVDVTDSSIINRTRTVPVLLAGKSYSLTTRDISIQDRQGTIDLSEYVTTDSDSVEFLVNGTKTLETENVTINISGNILTYSVKIKDSLNISIPVEAYISETGQYKKLNIDFNVAASPVPVELKYNESEAEVTGLKETYVTNDEVRLDVTTLRNELDNSKYVYSYATITRTYIDSSGESQTEEMICRDKSIVYRILPRTVSVNIDVKCSKELPNDGVILCNVEDGLYLAPSLEVVLEDWMFDCTAFGTNANLSNVTFGLAETSNSYSYDAETRTLRFKEYIDYPVGIKFFASNMSTQLDVGTLIIKPYQRDVFSDINLPQSYVGEESTVIKLVDLYKGFDSVDSWELETSSISTETLNALDMELVPEGFKFNYNNFKDYAAFGSIKVTNTSTGMEETIQIYRDPVIEPVIIDRLESSFETPIDKDNIFSGDIITLKVISGPQSNPDNYPPNPWYNTFGKANILLAPAVDVASNLSASFESGNNIYMNKAGDVTLTFVAKSDDVLHLEWCGKTLDIPIKVNSNVSSEYHVTKNLDNIEFEYDIVSMLLETAGIENNDANRARFTVVDNEGSDIYVSPGGNHRFDHSVGRYYVEAGLLKGLCINSGSNTLPEPICVTINDNLTGKAISLNVRFSPAYALFYKEQQSYNDGTVTIKSTGNNSKTLSTSYGGFNTIITEGNKLDIEVEVHVPNKVVDYVNVIYYTMYYSNRDLYFSTSAEDSIKLDDENKWQYYVDSSCSKIEFIPVLKDAPPVMSQTDVSLEVDSPDWSLYEDLTKYVKDYTEPVVFAVTDEDLRLAVTSNGVLVGKLEEDDQVPIRATDGRGDIIDFTLDVKVPEEVTIIINHNDVHGTVEDISVTEKLKIGDVVTFSTPAASGYEHVQTSVNSDVFNSVIVEEYEITAPVVEITTEYKEAMSVNEPDEIFPLSNWIGGGTLPVSYEKISGPNQIKVTKDLNFEVEGDLPSGTYDIGIRATDSSTPEAQVKEFVVPYEHVAEEAVWLYVRSEEAHGGYVTINAENYSVRNGVFNVAEGEEVTFTAVPSAGYEFDKWIQPDSTEATFTQAITENTTAVAQFKPMSTNEGEGGSEGEGDVSEIIDPLAISTNVVEFDYPNVKSVSINSLVSGGKAPYTFKTVQEYPNIGLSTDGELILYGDMKAGDYPITIKVMDRADQIKFFNITLKVYIDTKDFDVTIEDDETDVPPSIIIPEIIGWKKPYTYEKISGHDNISLNSETGELTIAEGTPSGDYTVEVKITDSSEPANTDTRSYTIKVRRPYPELVLPESGSIEIIIPREPQQPNWTDLNDYIFGLNPPFTFTKIEGHEGIEIVDGKVIIGEDVPNGDYMLKTQVTDSNGGTREIEVPITVERQEALKITYTVKPKEGGNATITSSNGVVNASVSANDGYTFSKLVVNGQDITENPYSFTPDEDTHIDVIFIKDMSQNTNNSANQDKDGNINIDANDFFEGGVPPFTFDIKEPVDGITIDKATGIITGQVGEEGATIVIVITDSSVPAKTKEIPIIVNPAGKFVPIVSVSGNGTVVADKESYREGEEVTFTATPSEGYVLKHFIYNGEVITGNPIKVIITGDDRLEAIFEREFTKRELQQGEDPFDLRNYVNGGEGDIIFKEDKLPYGFSIVDGRVAIDEETVVPGNHTLEIEATDENGNTVIITIKVTIENKKTVTLRTEVNPGNAGTATLSTYTAQTGDTVTATATPFSGYTFDKWLIGEEEFTSNPISYVVESEVVFTAIFKESNSIDLDNLGPADTVPPAINTEENKTDLDDIINGGSGNYIVEVIEIPEGVDFNNETNELTNNTNESKEVIIKVQDKEDESKSTTIVIVLPGIEQYSVNVSVMPEESGTVSGASTYTVGEEVILEAIANEGMRFVSWNIEGIEGVDSTTSTLKFIMPKNDVKIVAVFDTIQYEDVIEPVEGIWFAGDLSYDYTGSAIKPVLKIYDGNKLLREKVDYTLSYKNNKKAYTLSESSAEFNAKKAPTIVLKTKGNYKGTRNIYFTINPIDIKEANGLLEFMGATSNGKKVNVNPTLTWSGKKLKNKTDFTVESISGNSITAKGTYDMVIKGKGNFTGEHNFKLIVDTEKNIIPTSKLKVSKLPKLTYTGKELIPTGYVLKYGKDIPDSNEVYVTYRNNINVGKAELIVSGTGIDHDKDGISYTGQHVFNYTIEGVNVKKATLEGLEKSYIFTGERIVPDFKVVVDGKTLVKDKDYTLQATNNLNKGKATITIKAVESMGYSGSKTVSFAIKPESHFSVSFNSVSGNNFKLTKLGTKPSVSVYDGTQLLEEGVDYTVSYKNNKKVATVDDKKAPTLTVKGKGNYTGSQSLNFNIVPTQLSTENGVRLVVADKSASPKKGGYIQKFTLYDADGGKLTTKEYDKNSVTYTLVSKVVDGQSVSANEVLDNSSVVPAGSVIKLSIKGTGSYAGGEISQTYRIIEKNVDISKAKVSVRPQQYTGKEVTITSMTQFANDSVTLKASGSSHNLVLGKDFVIVEDSYVNNVKRGTAKVTIQGIGNYGGQKTISFKIGQRTINDFWTGLVNLFNLI